MTIFFAHILAFLFYTGLVLKFLAPAHALSPYVLNYIFMYKILLGVSCIIYSSAILGILVAEPKDSGSLDTFLKPKPSTQALILIRLLVIFFVGLTGVDWGAFTLLLVCQMEYWIIEKLVVLKLKEGRL